MSRLLAMKWIHMGEEPAVPAMTELGYCLGSRVLTHSYIVIQHLD